MLREVFRNILTGAIVPSEQSRRMMLAFAKIDPPQNQDSESEISAIEEEDLKSTKTSKKKEENQDENVKFRRDRSPSSSTRSDPRRTEESRKRAHSPSPAEVSKKAAVFQVIYIHHNVQQLITPFKGGGIFE